MFMASGLDIFAVFARFMHYYQVQFRPTSMHIFWDDESSRLWRTKILPTYKGQRTDDDGAKKDVYHILKLSLDIYKTLGVRQYFRHNQEADDLIYAFCATVKEPTVIVSSDGDLRQIKFDHVSIYDPSRRKIIEDRLNPVLKALMGDKSDNIDGYYRVGPKTAAILTEDPAKLSEFLISHKAIDENNKVVGDEIFKRNIQLVDLSLNPYIAENVEYVRDRHKCQIIYDYATAINKLKTNDVKGLSREAYKLFSSLSTLS
jgi:5'-3' exonuclease